MLKKIFWTEHAKIKMRQYGLSTGKLLQIIRQPERKEKGIAPGCTALMQTRKVYGKAAFAKGSGAPRGEIWLMYQDKKGVRTIISAWRYPGVSKPGESIPIPAEIKEELFNESV